MELLAGGRLSTLIKEKRRKMSKFSDAESSSIMRCILQATEYIHMNGIVHRDLKPGKNFLK
jgi:serine/threonine protein kinase